MSAVLTVAACFLSSLVLVAVLRGVARLPMLTWHFFAQWTLSGTAYALGALLSRHWLMGASSASSAVVALILWWRLRPRLCRCGHSRDQHRHYRRATDCSACTCRRWRRTWALITVTGGAQ